MKVSELKDQTLDWAVAKALGYDYEIVDNAVITGLSVMITDETDPYFGCSTDEVFNPSTNWNLAGPLIEFEMITVTPADFAGFEAFVWPKGEAVWGDTALEAICRCFVKSKLGDEIDLPEELQ